jgi:hypothetical protein
MKYQNEVNAWERGWLSGHKIASRTMSIVNKFDPLGYFSIRTADVIAAFTYLYFRGLVTYEEFEDVWNEHVCPSQKDRFEEYVKFANNMLKGEK